MTDLSTLEYVDSPDALAEWIDHLCGAQRIAVDTESDSFHHYQEKVCLIQMTANGRDAIIDPLKLEDIQPLGEVFADPTRIKIFHDVGYDLLCLKRDFGFEITGLFDTMLASRLLGKKKFGLASILEERFEFIADKRYQRSNWAQRPLSDAQLDYARFDTHYLPDLANQLQSELEQVGRWDWALEDFARLPTLVGEPTGRGGEVDPDGFWRVKGLRGLSAAEVGRVKVLYLVRDHIAQRLDRPPFKIFSDKVIINLATEPPDSMDDFGPRPGLRQSGVIRFGAEILRALKKAKSIKNSPPPGARRRRRNGRFQDPRIKERYEGLRTLRKELASTLELDPEVIMSNAALEHIARKPPKNVDELRLREGVVGWRAEIISDPIFDQLAAEKKSSSKR